MIFCIFHKACSLFYFSNSVNVDSKASNPEFATTQFNIFWFLIRYRRDSSIWLSICTISFFFQSHSSSFERIGRIAYVLIYNAPFLHRSRLDLRGAHHSRGSTWTSLLLLALLSTSCLASLERAEIDAFVLSYHLLVICCCINIDWWTSDDDVLSSAFSLIGSSFATLGRLLSSTYYSTAALTASCSPCCITSSTPLLLLLLGRPPLRFLVIDQA